MDNTPDRRDPPRPLDDELMRSRLVERLDHRWERTVTTVIAPSGFGKSTLLAQAMRANRVHPRGIDVWVSAERGDDGDGLIGALVHSLDVPAERPLVSQITDAIRAHSPVHVSLLVDDAHFIAPESPAATFVADMVRDLPANGHVVFASRTDPPVPLARLRSMDQVLDIAQDELLFTAAETEHVTGEPASVGAGWPALVRLGAASRRPGTVEDFVWEEYLPDLDEAAMAALTIVVIAGSADDRLYQAVTGSERSLETVLLDVPLLSWHEDGQCVAHDLWNEILRRHLQADGPRHLRGHIALAMLDGTNWERAFEIALEGDDWETARRAIMVAARRRQSLTLGPIADRWVKELSSEQRSTPEGRLLEGIALGAADTNDLRADEALTDALTRFRDRGDVSAEALTMSSVIYLAWQRRDIARVGEYLQRAEELEAEGPRQLSSTIAFIRATEADIRGDIDGALEALDSIGDDAGSATRLSADRWRANFLVLVGRATEAVECAQRLGRSSEWAFAANVLAVTKWFAGDPTEVVAASRDIVLAPPERERDRRSSQIYGVMFAVGLGRSVPAPTETSEDGRDATLFTFARAACAIADGDESRAASLMDDLLSEFPIGENGRSLGELRRFLPCGYVLSSAVRDYFDSDDSLGPLHLMARDLARTFVQARAGRWADGEELPSTPAIVTMLPFRWTMELACRANHHGSDEGRAIVQWLLDETDAPVEAELERLSGVPGPVGDGARTLVGQVLDRPAHSLRLNLFGRPEFVRDGAVIDPPEWRRARVREVLAVLVLEGATSRERMMAMLWPEKDQDAARNNLRNALSQVRKLLEPDREQGAHATVVRQEVDHLVLAGPPMVDADVWEFRRAMRAASDADTRGDVRSARSHFAIAAALVNDGVLESLDSEWSDLHRHQYATDAAHAMLRTAELVLADGDHTEALALARTVSERDQYDERAHRLIAAAHLQSGDRAGAREALDQCRSLLHEAGLEPAPETEMLIRLATA